MNGLLSRYAAKTWARTHLRPYLHKSERLYRLYAALRAPIEERDVVRSQRRYQTEATRRGISVATQSDLRACLRRRLAHRNITPMARPKGDLHMFVTYPNAMWESTLPKILAPFGHVTVFDWRALGYDDTSPRWLECRDSMNALMLGHFDKAHDRRPVDVVFGYLSGRVIGPETLTAMGNRGAVVMNICMDDKGGFPGPRENGRYRSPAAIASAVDLNLTTSADSLVKYSVHGGLSLFFPLAADPQIQRSYDVPYDFDVTFVGGRHAWRPFFIDRLERMGIHVETFGSGWPNGPISDEERIRLYSRSRINLGFSATGNSRNVRYLKNRDFEIPMCGGLYLTQANEELSRCFDVGREIAVYDDERDCAKRIRFLLEHTEEAQSIRDAGRTRALRDHTWDRRFSELFEIAGLLERSRAEDSRPQ